jgi:hypothetical protein
MDVRFVASVSVVSTDLPADQALFIDGLGLPLQAPEDLDSEYRFSESVDGTKHFGVWPLAEAAESCFGTTDWPSSHPVPQASIEFEVDDVGAAAQELVDKGHVLLHGTRTEPWGQVIARVQSPGGLVIGVCHTPHLREG